MNAKRLLKGLLKFIVFCAVLLVVSMIAVSWRLSYSIHKLERYSQRMRVGMPVRDFVKVMPTDYFFGRVLRERRDVPCRNLKGEFVPPESDDPPPSAPARAVSKAEIAKLAPCPVVTFAHFKHTKEDKIFLYDVEQVGGGGTVVTGDEFATFIEREFRDSRFYVGFSYETGTPQHQTFGVWFDRNGRIAEVLHPWGWD